MCVVRTGYIISDALCKMEMWGPLFKNYQKCKHSDSLNQVQSPSDCGALCNPIGHMPVKGAPCSRLNKVMTPYLFLL